MIVNSPHGDAGNPPGPVILFDSRCPVSAALLRRLRFRAAAGPSTLADTAAGRSGRTGGIAVMVGGRLHTGADGLAVLARIALPPGRTGPLGRGLLARLFCWAFGVPARAHIFYPPLWVAGTLARRLSAADRRRADRKRA